MKRNAYLPYSLAMLLLLFSSIQVDSFAQAPKPTASQLDWHQQEFYLFVHFGPNTFTGKEWGHGDEPEDIFNPTNLDTDQWCRVAKAAGAKGIIITAKHHDGFCLWPSKYSTHTVRESKWRDGKGDVVGDLSKSCKKYGLKFGVYISPWDRNHPLYGTDAYNEVYVNTMKEIFSKYGPIWELWWDGANGEGPNGKKQVYDFPLFEKTIRGISPNTVIFSDIGPDIRWVGNERGIAGTTNWNTLDTAGFKRGQGGPSTDTLNSGNVFGKLWIPAECDVSIRPGWFYHQEEDAKVKTPQQLFDLYLKSVGRGANLLLNVPPDTRGLIHENDSAALMGFLQLRRQFDNNLALQASGYKTIGGKLELDKAHNDNNAGTSISINSSITEVGLQFTKATAVNCIVLQEDLKDGQHCAAFRVQLKDANGKALQVLNGTTIGQKRILTFPKQEVSSISFVINDQHGSTAINEIGAYLLDKGLQ